MRPTDKVKVAPRDLGYVTGLCVAQLEYIVDQSFVRCLSRGTAREIVREHVIVIILWIRVYIVVSRLLR